MGIERVPRLAALGETDATRSPIHGEALAALDQTRLQKLSDPPVPVPAATATTPTAPKISGGGLRTPAVDSTSSLFCPAGSSTKQYSLVRQRCGRTIDHHQVTIPPTSGKSAEASQGWIVALAIRNGRVQADKHRVPRPDSQLRLSHQR